MWKNDSMAAFNSTLALTYSVVAFVFCIQIFIEHFADVEIPFFFDNIFTSIGLTGVILIINYNLFEKNDKYLSLAEKYDSQKGNRMNWIIKGLLTWLVSLGPILTFIFLS